MRQFLLITLTIFLLGCKSEKNNLSSEYDLIIYGSTPAGISAAIQSKRMGKTVLLISQTNHIGGTTTGGLTWTDYGEESTIGGLADEFYVRIKQWYDKPENWVYENQDSSSLYSKAARYMPSFEPKVALKIFEDFLKEHRIEVIRSEQVTIVDKENSTVRAITTNAGHTYRGKMFIDATYEGDLMALAGISFHLGRESEEVYGEDLAGVLGEEERFTQPKKFFGKEISPYDENGNLLFGIYDGEMGIPGAGDNKIQAYNYRMCLSKHPDNRLPINRPSNYDSSRYELLARYIAVKPPEKLRDLIKVSEVPNLKTDINDGCPFSTDYIGANWEYPEGDSLTREAIIQDHIDYTKGLIYFIGNDTRVPEKVRTEMQEYGYPKDEYPQNNNWTPQIYVRESRRMIGEYVMRQQDCIEDTIKKHSVGLGSYGVDSHHIQRIVVNGEIINEGNFLAKHHPYEIPYESLIPKQEECTNLLVPVCLSSSHIAFGSLRMEPVYMILGQSAAIAAILSLEEGVTLQKIDYQLLNDNLKKFKQKVNL